MLFCCLVDGLSVFIHAGLWEDVLNGALKEHFRLAKEEGSLGVHEVVHHLSNTGKLTILCPHLHTHRHTHTCTYIKRERFSGPED